MLFDVEAPEYHEARAFMTAREALGVALRCEEKAYAFFVEALPGIQDAEVKALFDELAAEEVTHQDLVRRELLRLPNGGPAEGDAFVDEPTAQ
jgi:rubrerythrin